MRKTLPANFSFITFFVLLIFSVPSFSQPKEEVRAVWLTRVYNIDWPKTTNVSVHKQDLINILDKLKAANFNTIMFQLRARGDVAYPSKIEPYAKEFTGIMGKDPGYDVLRFVIDECHKRGMEVHGWMVTYKVYDGKAVPPAMMPAHIVNAHPEYCKLYSSGGTDTWYLDPGIPEVRTYLRSIVQEIVANYDIDAIHFDYIRYPESDFNDADTYSKYGAGKVKSDWRRENINQFVYDVYDDIQKINPRVKVGSAPVGVYKNTTQYNGWERYNAVFQDSRDWLSKKKHDYMCPQIYWQINSAQSFKYICRDEVKYNYGRHIYTGMAVYRIEAKKRFSSEQEKGDWDAFYMRVLRDSKNTRGDNWPVTEMTNQIDVSRAEGALGQCYFSSVQITQNIKNVYEIIKASQYKYPANIPSMRWKDSIPPNKPKNLKITRTNDLQFSLSWETPDPAPDKNDIKYYNVYSSDKSIVDITDIKNVIKFQVTSTKADFTLPEMPQSNMYFVVTAYDPGYNESQPSNTIPLDDGIQRLKLSAPANQSQMLAVNPKLEWENDGSPSFDIQISEKADFSTVLITKTNINQPYLFTPDLQYEKKYYWRVKSSKIANWSYTWNFTTKKKFLEKIWSRSVFDGNLPAWFSTDGFMERGIAYGNKHLYVISRNDGIRVQILDSLTGNDISSLNTFGIAGGSVALNDIETSSDGQILACNITTNSKTDAFKIYKWKNETSVPEVLLTYTGDGFSMGNNFTFTGSISGNGTILVPVSASNKVIKWTITNGTAGVPVIISLEGITDMGKNASVAIKGADIYVNGLTNMTPTLYGTDGKQKGSIAESLITKESTTIRSFIFDNFNYLAVFQTQNGTEKQYGQNVRIINIENSPAKIDSADIFETTFSLGTNTNPDGIGDIAFTNPSSTGDVIIYVLSANNGIAAYRMIQKGPNAKSLSITGNMEPGFELTGKYTYSDPDNDLEGLTTFQWYKADDAFGKNKAPIANATNKSYMLDISDAGKYIIFEVSPRANSGVIKGHTTDARTNAISTSNAVVPVASNALITGNLTIGLRLIGNYSYSDANSDLEGKSTFQWYSADDANGKNKVVMSGELGKTHLIRDEDRGKYIAFEVTPVSATGIFNTTIGTSVISPFVGPMVILGIDGVDKEIFDAYPNPVHERLSIRSKTEIESLSLTNILGQNMYQILKPGLVCQINTLNLQKGVYLLKLKLKNNITVCRKIIKE
jgi:uncharacterized lipoprotein YddW (UPF0748 family)